MKRQPRTASSSSKELCRLDPVEKHKIMLDAAHALDYLSVFELIHRDFRGCNMHLISRRKPGNGDDCALKVLDLGVMISAEEAQAMNNNLSVQAFRRRGDTEE